MNRLERRVSRLEGGIASDEVLIWGSYPLGCRRERFLEVAEATARKMGYEPPYNLNDVECSNLPGGEDDMDVIFIGTGTELSEIINSVTNNGNRIDNRPEDRQAADRD